MDHLPNIFLTQVVLSPLKPPSPLLNFYMQNLLFLSELKSLLLQGLNYVAALLLLVMKTEEDAFWMLAVLLENVLVNDCYTNNLSGCHVEQRVFKDLLPKKCPRYSRFHYL